MVPPRMPRTLGLTVGLVVLVVLGVWLGTKLASRGNEGPKLPALDASVGAELDGLASDAGR